jgi:hypothetical protein
MVKIFAAKPAPKDTSPAKAAARTPATATADLQVDPADPLFLKSRVCFMQRGFCFSRDESRLAEGSAF